MMLLRCVVMLFLATAAATAVTAEIPSGGALAGDRPRVLISTDIGGSDPDDVQSMVHLLVYADVLDIEGLVSTCPNFAGRVEHIDAVLKAYAVDRQALVRASDRYPTVEALRAGVRQGAIAAQSATEPSAPTPGALLIVERAKANDPRPLYVLAWGALTDVAAALHHDPAIAPRLRLISVGAWNTSQDQLARAYVDQCVPHLWWIESDTTFRGMYLGGKQDGDQGDRSFPLAHVASHGALGAAFMAAKPEIKMGDTPTLLYLLRGAPEDPTGPHWGGAFVRPDPTGRPTWWHDVTEPAQAEGKYPGARTVNRWRESFLADWRARMERCTAP
ncbi:MAG TPA: DUF1593 domain-containing protein [Planctomycetota bacterium]|nr:DUF1593 domain-containing protein [Planctomycetota bacterium]